MKTKVTYSQVKEALEAGYVSPLNSEKVDIAKASVEICINEYAKILHEKLCIKFGQRQLKDAVNQMGYERFESIIVDSWDTHKANIAKGFAQAINIIEIEIEMAFL